jgi:hypothetical protein
MELNTSPDKAGQKPGHSVFTGGAKKQLLSRYIAGGDADIVSDLRAATKVQPELDKPDCPGTNHALCPHSEAIIQDENMSRELQIVEQDGRDASVGAQATSSSEYLEVDAQTQSSHIAREQGELDKTTRNPPVEGHLIAGSEDTEARCVSVPPDGRSCKVDFSGTETIDSSRTQAIRDSMNQKRVVVPDSTCEGTDNSELELYTPSPQSSETWLKITGVKSMRSSVVSAASEKTTSNPDSAVSSTYTEHTAVDQMPRQVESVSCPVTRGSHLSVSGVDGSPQNVK